jgi:hypothetical protein
MDSVFLLGIRSSIGLGHVGRNMGQITVQPEQEPEQWRRTEGNGDLDGLAWFLAFWGGLGTENTPKAVWRSGTTSFQSTF